MWFRNLVIHIHHYSNKEKVGMHAYFRLALVSPAADGNSQSLINTGGGGGRSDMSKLIFLLFSVTSLTNLGLVFLCYIMQAVMDLPICYR